MSFLGCAQPRGCRVRKYLPHMPEGRAVPGWACAEPVFAGPFGAARQGPALPLAQVQAPRQCLALAFAFPGEAFGGPTPRLAPLLSSLGFPSLGTVGILGWIIFSSGAVL